MRVRFQAVRCSMQESRGCFGYCASVVIMLRPFDLEACLLITIISTASLVTCSNLVLSQKKLD